MTNKRGRILAAGLLTDAQLAAELERLGRQWDEFRRDCEGGGSPGEGLYERMGALETERKRRLGRRTPTPR